MKKKILFICTHKEARSQMAEGYMRAKYGDRYEVFSGKLTWKVAQPWSEPGDDSECRAKQKALEMIERLKKKQQGRSPPVQPTD